MHVQLNTNNYIEGNADLAERVTAEVEDALGRFGDQITRVEVHLSDVNSSSKSGVDVKCSMEVRIAGRQPLAVSEQASSIDEAVSGAAAKLERALESDLGRIGHHKGRTSFGGDQTI